MRLDVTTNSKLKTFSRCPRQALYAYHDEIRPRQISRPLRMGQWFHNLLEAHYKGDGWEDEHQRLIEHHGDKFFEEEVGDIPPACYRIMKSYLWHYQLEKKYGWKVLDVEGKLVTHWPDGSEFWIKYDLLVEDAQGNIWIVDHKLWTRFPGIHLRLLQSQSLLYIWVAWKNKIPVTGFIWNFVRMKAPGIPRQNQNGLLSRRKIETDYPTLRKAIRDYGIDPREYADDLQKLRAQYWRPDKSLTSPFFAREVLDGVTKETVMRKVREAYRTKGRMDEYDWDNRDGVERVVDRTCVTQCPYPLLCTTELYGGNADLVKRLNYHHVDPLGYYEI